MDVLFVKEEIGLEYVFKVVMKDLDGKIVFVMYVCGYDVYIVVGLGVVWVLVNYLLEW